MPVTPKHSSKQFVIASYLFLVTLFSLLGVSYPVLAHIARNAHSLESFSATSVNATVSPTIYDCSRNQNIFNFMATINVSPSSSGGNITYTWRRSDGATMSPITLAVPPGQTTATITDTWALGVDAPKDTYWEQVSITDPNNITSNQATFTKSCSRLSVTSVNATVSPTTYDCSQIQNTFNFKATINLSLNPDGEAITYTWPRSDGATMSPITLGVPPGQTTVTITDTWTLEIGSPKDTYWEQVSITAPDSITSNKATFTKSC